MDEMMLKPINVFVKFSPVLEMLTEQGEMKVIMNDGAPFVFLLHSVFTSYPEIERRYPPGKLAIILNDRKPTDHDVLHEGDRIAFFA